MNRVPAILRNKYAVLSGIAIFLVVMYWAYSAALSSMKTQSLNININKVEDIERLVSYQVFSDFYYRMVSTDARSDISAEYTRVIPLVTEIGFEREGSGFSVSLNSRLNGKPITLDSNDRNQLTRYIRMMERFSGEYARIVAADDPVYLTQAVERVREMLPNKVDISSEDVTFGNHTLGDTAVSIQNLDINPLLLNELQENIKQVRFCRRDWCPHILYIEFAENDTITLRLLDRVEHFTRDEFENHILSNTPESVLVKTVVFHENKQNPILIAFESARDSEHANRVSVYMLDVSGYIYQLTYNAFNPLSFDTFFNDFLKIAYGIRFVDAASFTNTYYTVESTIQSRIDEIVNLVTRTKEEESRLGQYQLMEHFGVESYFSSQVGAAVYKLADTYQSSSGIVSDRFRLGMREFEDAVGHFDSLDFNELTNNEQLNNLSVLSAAFDLQYHDVGMLGRSSRASRAAQQLISSCDTIECLHNNYGD